MDQEKIGIIIKKIRQDNKLSQAAFADKLGVSPQAVSKWENGKNLPDISTLKEIKKQFNINIDEIIDGDSIKRINKVKNMRNTILFILLIVTIISLLIFILFHFNNMKKDKFEFEELTSASTDFKISGNVVKTDGRTSLIINNVIYTGSDEDMIYDELTCTLYEEKDSTKTKITSCDKETNVTLTNYLENLKIRMDHYSANCTMFTESNMFIEINAVNGDKTIIYKIPIQIIENSCY